MDSKQDAAFDEFSMDEALNVQQIESGDNNNDGRGMLENEFKNSLENTLESSISGSIDLPGSTQMKRSMLRTIASTMSSSQKSFVNSEKYWKSFEDSNLYKNLLMVSDEGVNLAEIRKTSRPVHRSPAPAYRSPTRKLRGRNNSTASNSNNNYNINFNSGTSNINSGDNNDNNHDISDMEVTNTTTLSSTVGEIKSSEDDEIKPIGLNESIFDFIDPDQDEVINSKNPEVYDGFSELPVLPECHFTDVSCHYSNADTSRTVKFESDVEPRIYWIRKDLGTLGYINIGDDVRVVLLRGLKKPKNIEVVDHRVYWLEEGDEWQYNGRICFLDTKTKQVHTLLSSLSEPRGLHVTSHHHVFYLETNREFYQELVINNKNSNRGIVDGGGSSIVNIDLSQPSSLMESLASSRKYKLNQDSTNSQNSNNSKKNKLEDKWSRIWKVKMLSGNLIDLSVPGANSHLSGMQRTICKIPPENELWEQVSEFASEVDGMHLMTKGTGYAQPCDVTVVFSDVYEKPKVIIGVDLYEMRTIKVKKDDQDRLDFLKNKQASPSSKKKLGRRSTMPNIPAQARKKKVKFEIEPVVERVQIGGGLLYCDVIGLHRTKASRVDSDDAFMSNLDVLCTLPSAAHRLYAVPTHYSKKQVEVFDIMISCNFDAPSIFPLPGVEDTLDIPGFGLAHLAIPKRFEIAVDEMKTFLTPLTSRGMTSFAPIETRLTSKNQKVINSRGLLKHPMMMLPKVGNGIYAFLHASLKVRKVLPPGWLTTGKDLRNFSRYPPEERKRIREDAVRAGELSELNKMEMSDSESENNYEGLGNSNASVGDGRSRANSLAMSIMSNTGSLSTFAGGGTNANGGAAMNVKVILRCRPLFEKEVLAGVKDVVVCTRKDCTVIPLREEQSEQTFKFERVFNRNANQMEIFEESVRPSVLAALDGYNVTVFAYGQTGTGKTYTMEGKMEQSDLSGIIPRSVYTIFEILLSTVDSRDWNVSVSHLEIYQEQLTDLLAPDELRNTLSARLATENITTSQALVDAAAKRGVVIKLDTSKHGKARKKLINSSSRMSLKTDGEQEFLDRLEQVAYEQAHKLRIRKTDDKGMEVMNLTTIPVKSPDEIFEILDHSIKKRATAETLCNKFSSRSHAIFSINVSINERDENGERTGILRTGRLNLVDLSGSENIGRSGSVGTRFKEARNINQGLLALGRVIKARTEGAQHVPYRDSKLTQLLQESLGGNSVTTLILTVSPNHREMAETLSTLNYAHKAKIIQNRPSKNLKQTGEKGDKGGKGRRRVGGDGDDLVPLIPEGAEFLIKTAPWIGRVPIRAPGSRSRKIVAKDQVPRMYHAPSADWVRFSVLNNSNSTTALSGNSRSFASTKNSKSDDNIINFGYTPFKPPPPTPTLSSREQSLNERSGVQTSGSQINSDLDLNSQALNVLRKLYEKFDANALKLLEKQLLKARGRGPKLGLKALDGNQGTNPMMRREVYRGSANSSRPNSRRRPSTSSGIRGDRQRSVSRASSMRSGTSSRSSNDLRLPSTPTALNLDFEGFVQLFVACAKADPSNAVKTVGVLGYRRNFAKIPTVKNKYGKETLVKEKDAREQALPSLTVLKAKNMFKGLIKPKTAAEKLKARRAGRKKGTSKRGFSGGNGKEFDPKVELIQIGPVPTPSRILWKWMVTGGSNSGNMMGSRGSRRRTRPSTAH